MNLLQTNLLLALLWATLTGVFTVANFAAGFGLAFGVLYLTRSDAPSREYFGRTARIARFVAIFLRELLMANLRVARDVLSPRIRVRPAVIAIPLRARTNAEITILANMISLTPGTLTLDISEDRSTLYIHTMDVGNPDDLRRQIQDNLEAPLMEVMR